MGQTDCPGQTFFLSETDPMQKAGYTVYRYRWVLLAAYAGTQAGMQLLWITFAPVTGTAAEFYGVQPLDIGLLSMIFMIVYLFVSVPASWLLDTRGLRIGLGLGTLLYGGFGLLRGLCGSDYTVVLVATIGIAVAQPFVLNSVTKVASHWFPLEERATAAGIAVNAQYVGIVFAMWATPWLVRDYGLPRTLAFYGVGAVVSAALLLLFLRERPPTPPSPLEESERIPVRAGLSHIARRPEMRRLILIFFIGLGLFNAVTTWIEQILSPRGFGEAEAGAAGAIMMIGGICGASILPPLSDRTGRRRPWMLLAVVGTVPGLLGLTFAGSYPLLIASSFAVGFFFMSAGPIFYQYSAEVSFPAPEATSQGLLVLAGQISGIAFIYGMDWLRGDGGTMRPTLVILIGLALLNVALVASLPESGIAAGRGAPGRPGAE
jgi:MFS family permease